MRSTNILERIRRSFLLALLFLPGALVAQSGSVAVTNVTVIPMNVSGSLPNQTVLVRNGRIVLVGPAESVEVPNGALRIDGTGKFLLPGLADMHVHISTPDELPLYLANGVTTVRNMNGRPAHLDWRTRLQKGRLRGPRLYTSGPTTYRAASAAEGERLVRDQHRTGYDGIKVYDGVSAEAFETILAAAKELRMPVWGHVNESFRVSGIVSAGQKSIEHVEDIFAVEFDEDPKTPTEAFLQTVQELRSPGVWVCPTLIAFGTVARQLADLEGVLRHPGMQYLPAWAGEEWSPARNYYKRNFSPDQATAFAQRWFRHKEFVELMQSKGVRLLAGSDAAVPVALPGFSLPDELELLVEVGLSPYEALRAGTYEPALLLDAEDEWGSIQAGRSGDLLLLEADPLVDIRNVRRLQGVMVRGEWLSGKQLRELLGRLRGDERQRHQRLIRWLLRGNVAATEYLSAEDPFHKLTDWLMMEIARRHGYRTALAVHAKYDQQKAESPITAERTLNTLGYRLLERGEYPAAIAVLERNQQAFPRSANACDSLAEAFLRAGRNQEAAHWYSKALEIDPDFDNARHMLKEMGIIK